MLDFENEVKRGLKRNVLDAGGNTKSEKDVSRTPTHCKLGTISVILNSQIDNNSIKSSLYTLNHNSVHIGLNP